MCIQDDTKLIQYGGMGVMQSTWLTTFYLSWSVTLIHGSTLKKSTPNSPLSWNVPTIPLICLHQLKQLVINLLKVALCLPINGGIPVTFATPSTAEISLTSSAGGWVYNTDWTRKRSHTTVHRDVLLSSNVRYERRIGYSFEIKNVSWSYFGYIFKLLKSNDKFFKNIRLFWTH
jgi:hypothetical protein